MSLVTRRDQIAGARFAVLGEREPLDVVVEQPSQVVRHPLADARGQILLGVRADGADDGDEQDGGERDVQNRIRVLPEDVL